LEEELAEARKKVSELDKELARHKAEKAAYKARAKELEEMVNAPAPNSSNSGISSAKEIFKKGRSTENEAPGGQDGPPKRKRGGQKNHKAHNRSPFRLMILKSASSMAAMKYYAPVAGRKWKDAQSGISREIIVSLKVG
jgi:hypothetical protein